VLGGQYDPNRSYNREAAKQTALDINKKLTPFLPWGITSKSRSEDLKSALSEICEQARQIALLFRSNKTEYVWMQPLGYYKDIFLDNDKVEIVGSMGPKSMKDGNDEMMMVFGGVIKGGGISGSIRSEMHFLRKCEVLLGPFAG
jgi:hypothetical protein